jgi:hypothetical protein
LAERFRSVHGSVLKVPGSSPWCISCNKRARLEQLVSSWASDKKSRWFEPGLDSDHILSPITINWFAGVDQPPLICFGVCGRMWESTFRSGLLLAEFSTDRRSSTCVSIMVYFLLCYSGSTFFFQHLELPSRAQGKVTPLPKHLGYHLAFVYSCEQLTSEQRGSSIIVHRSKYFE